MMMLFQRWLLACMLCILGFASGQEPFLPVDEVKALQNTGSTLGMTAWNFSTDPCTALTGVDCDCSFANNTLCHVTSISLPHRKLAGHLPPEIIGLPFLQKIDFSWNALQGSIPPGWGSTKLTHIVVPGNRIGGSIPKELGNITTLLSLHLEFNQLSGAIPEDLGNLPQLEDLILSSNNLTGQIPKSFEKLSTLNNFQINDNNLVGRIPWFIQNWTNMVTLMILASGLNGPIPPGIASLTNLTDLRISDLSGNESTFPPISNITTLGTLIFRSCNIIGLLPGYIGGMTTLKVLDLSFNNLIGSIPDSFVGLQESDFIYLTGNSLTGPVPAWMLNSSHRIDLSYNNLTSEGLDRNCQSNKLNLFASSKGHTFGTVSCLRNISCQRNYSSLHINCGGRRVTDDNGTTYEEDTDVGGPADFRLSGKMWGFSNTGHFWDYDQRRDYSFIWPQNSSGSGQESQLYATARFSTLSLTYYAFCLINRNYTVRLHFSEIMMTGQLIDPRRGRRVFDVFIQGKRVLKDFNIENEAGGDYKEISKYFTAEVYDNTLDIRFYWGSRGKRNDYEYTNNDTYGAEGNDFVTVNAEVYGPLISAISVDPYDTSPLETGNSLLVGGRGISTGAKVGIAVAAPFIVFAVLAILWWKCHLRSKAISQIDLQGSDLQTGSFSLRQIREATNNFDPVNKIGEGGFGPVYKGNLLGGTTIAVKQLSPKSNQGNREFVNEIGIISAIQHPHLVKLYGCCVEENQLLLVYEYMENNSLARALFGPIEQQLHLDWPTRHKICIGVAKGLAYLHEESRLKIVHRDIKATNVLLDGNLIPKISDFGLAKLHEEDDTHISTRIAGTLGYMAPEYASRGYLTDKADVYSFGVVLLEIVSGRSNMSIKQDSDCPCLLDWVDSLKENQDLLEIVDPRLGSNFNKNEVMDVINVSILCTNAVAMKRPSMSAVVSILEGKDGITGLVWNPSFSLDRMKCEDRSSSYNEGASVSVDVPLTASSTSYADLYPISLNSDYLKKRRS